MERETIFATSRPLCYSILHAFSTRVLLDLDANEMSLETMRPAGQTLRFPGYPQQAAPQTRNPLGASRLQNTTKLGTQDLNGCSCYATNYLR